MPRIIKIRKEELLTILRKNLKLHKKIYDVAFAKFKINYKNKLKILLANANKNKFEFNLNSVIMPTNHEDDYKTVIKMVEMHCEEKIDLTEDDYTQYVLNRFDWITSFRHAYIANISSCSSSSSASSSYGVSSQDLLDYFGDQQEE